MEEQDLTIWDATLTRGSRKHARCTPLRGVSLLCFVSINGLEEPGRENCEKWGDVTFVTLWTRENAINPSRSRTSFANHDLRPCQSGMILQGWCLPSHLMDVEFEGGMWSGRKEPWIRKLEIPLPIFGLALVPKHLRDLSIVSPPPFPLQFTININSRKAAGRRPNKYTTKWSWSVTFRGHFRRCSKSTGASGEQSRYSQTFQSARCPKILEDQGSFFQTSRSSKLMRISWC